MTALLLWQLRWLTTLAFCGVVVLLFGWFAAVILAAIPVASELHLALEKRRARLTAVR